MDIKTKQYCVSKSIENNNRSVTSSYFYLVKALLIRAYDKLTTIYALARYKIAEMR
jgi:hypothetical protein